MPLPVALVSIRLCVRLLLGVLLVSGSLSKLAHPRQFQQDIQDYHVVPSMLEKKLTLTVLLSIAIPLAELLAGLGLIGGFWLVPVIAGASLAGIDLGLTQPTYAKSTESNCYKFCTGCVVHTCVYNGNCAHSGQGSYYITYTYQAGCEPNCSFINGASCSYSCSC